MISDGLLHAAELIALVAGFFLLADLRRAGGFQLFDALVDHKLLRVHQIRYGVDLLPYDIGWVVSGLVLLLAGFVLAVRARSSPRGGAVPGD